MKKIFYSFIIGLAFMAINAQAQNVQNTVANVAKAYSAAPVVKEQAPKPQYWTTSLMTNFNFIQTGYFNWAKGGINNIALDMYLDANANYKKGEMYWNNRLQLDYGFLYSEDKPIMQKSNDRMLLESTWGHKVTNTLSYSAKFIFMNQFSNNYNYLVPAKPADRELTKEDWLNARVLKSGFLSPADITLGLGVDWIPNNWLKVNFAPATGGLKIVKNPLLRKAYGMQRKAEFKDMNQYPDAKKGSGNYYKSVRLQFGAMLTTDANIQINDNFTAGTQLILFSDYLNKPQNVRVNWTNRFMWKLAKYFTLNFQTDLIYDDTVLITTDKYPNGRKLVQFMEALKFGFTYTFASKKK